MRPTSFVFLCQVHVISALPVISQFEVLVDDGDGFVLRLSPYHSECMMLSVVVISFDIGQVFMLGCLDNEISDSHATFSYKQGFNIQFYEKWKLGKPFLLSHYMSENTMISVM